MKELVLLIHTAAVMLAFLTFGSTGTQAQFQIIRTVNTTSDTVVPNACITGSAGCSLRGAMQIASSDVLISFNIPASDPNCSAGVCTITVTSELPALTGSNITISGPGADRLVITRQLPMTPRAFLVNNPVDTRIQISGFTIRNFVTTVPFVSPITKNGNGTLDLIDMHFTGNGALDGGAIYVLGGSLNLIRSVLDTNFADGEGGGIFVGGGTTCSVINTTITRNVSAAGIGGGGIFAQGGARISNSTIHDNESRGDSAFGGGIMNSGGVVTVKSTIIARNLAAGNVSPDVFGMFGSAGFNLIGKTDGSSGFVAPTDLTGTVASPLDARFDTGGVTIYGGSTPLRGLRPDSPAVDKGSSVPLLSTVPLPTDQRSTGFRRTRDHPLIPNAAGGDGTDIGAYERNTSAIYDFEGDGRTDIGIFRPTGGEWWIDFSLPTLQTRALQFGASTDMITPADFTGDGLTDIAFWRPATGQWFVLRSENLSFFAFGFGTGGDIPAPGDFDGDRKADAAVFRPSTGTWFILKSTGPLSIVQFGVNGDIPVVADYDGDGRSDIAIFRPSNGQWWLNRSTAGVVAYTFGTSTDKPVQGDFTGDDKADVAFWRPSNGNWIVLRSEDTMFYGFAFGVNGDIPAPGDYDGDGKFDATVFRPSSGLWFSQKSNGGFAIQQFGLNGDRPIPNAFVP